VSQHDVLRVTDGVCEELIRDKRSWEKQIKFLGGTDYTVRRSAIAKILIVLQVISAKVHDSDGKRAVGSDG